MSYWKTLFWIFLFFQWRIGNFHESIFLFLFFLFFMFFILFIPSSSPSCPLELCSSLLPPSEMYKTHFPSLIPSSSLKFILPSWEALLRTPWDRMASVLRWLRRFREETKSCVRNTMLCMAILTMSQILPLERSHMYIALSTVQLSLWNAFHDINCLHTVLFLSFIEWCFKKETHFPFKAERHAWSRPPAWQVGYTEYILSTACFLTVLKISFICPCTSPNWLPKNWSSTSSSWTVKLQTSSLGLPPNLLFHLYISWLFQFINNSRKLILPSWSRSSNGSSPLPSAMLVQRLTKRTKNCLQINNACQFCVLFVYAQQTTRGRRQ